MDWFNAAQTNPAELRDFDDMAEKVEQVRVSFEFESECAKVNAGKNNLLETSLDERSDFCEHIFHSRASSRPAHLWNNTVGAMRIASILQLDQRASLPACLFHGRQKIIAVCIKRRANYFDLRVRSALIEDLRQNLLFDIPHNKIDARQLGQKIRIAFGVASGHDDARSRIFSVYTTDRLANLLIGAVSNSAGIDYNQIRVLPALDFHH
jgi:hypothetical protein